MNIKSIILGLSYLLVITTHAQNATFNHVKTLNTGYVDYAMDNFLDTNSNLYVVGTTSSKPDFDPGVGEHIIQISGEVAGYIQKFDSSGAFLWAKVLQLKNYGASEILKISVDDSGDVYVAGTFRGICDFDPSISEYLVNTGSTDTLQAFVLKLSSEGAFRWVKTYHGNFDLGPSSVRANIQLASHDNGVYFGVTFADSIESFFTQGGHDFLIQSLSNQGDVVWNKTFGGLENDRLNDFGVDSLGNLWVTGGFFGTVKLEVANEMTTYSSNGDEDIFLGKILVDGVTETWETFGSTWEDVGIGVDVNATGLLLAGNYSSTVHFNGSSTLGRLTATTSREGFLLKRYVDGDYAWVRAFKKSGYIYPKDVALDSYGNAYLTGYFSDEIDLNPHASFQDLHQTYDEGKYDVFMTKLDVKGGFIYGKTIGDVGHDYAQAISVSELGKVFVSGYYGGDMNGGKIDFDPSENTFRVNSKGFFDAFTLGLFPTTPQITEVFSSHGGYELSGSQINWSTTNCAGQLTITFDFQGNYTSDFFEYSNSNNSITLHAFNYPLENKPYHIYGSNGEIVATVNITELPSDIITFDFSDGQQLTENGKLNSCEYDGQHILFHLYNGITSTILSQEELRHAEVKVVVNGSIVDTTAVSELDLRSYELNDSDDFQLDVIHIQAPIGRCFSQGFNSLSTSLLEVQDNCLVLANDDEPAEADKVLLVENNRIVLPEFQFFELVNLQGISVKKGADKTIDLSNLNSGMYILRTKEISQRIVKW